LFINRVLLDLPLRESRLNATSQAAQRQVTGVCLMPIRAITVPHDAIVSCHASDRAEAKRPEKARGGSATPADLCAILQMEKRRYAIEFFNFMGRNSGSCMPLWVCIFAN